MGVYVGEPSLGGRPLLTPPPGTAPGYELICVWSIHGRAEL